MERKGHKVAQEMSERTIGGKKNRRGAKEGGVRHVKREKKQIQTSRGLRGGGEPKNENCTTKRRKKEYEKKKCGMGCAHRS